MKSSSWRRGRRGLLWALTVGVAGFYLTQLWQIRRGLFIARRPQCEEKIEKSLPHVSIVVPARNERRNIRRCVISLLMQDYPDFDVIVVDDGSTDGTADILAELQHGPGGQRLSVVRAGALPKGWAGKPHAMAIGASLAHGEWLLFTDADTFHHSGALAWAMREGIHRNADLVSLLSHMEMVDPANHMIMPIVMMGISAQYAPDRIADPKSPIALANGQYILISRDMYDQVGGYSSPQLRGSLVDDRDMAAAVKRHGGTLALLDGRDHLDVCMYRSLAEAWKGWSKNAYTGSRGGMPAFVVMTLGLPVITVLPFVLWLIGIFSRRVSLALAGAIQVASIFAYRSSVDHHLRHSRLWGLTHPIGGAIFTALLGNAIRRKLTRRGVTWSGRSYDLKQERIMM
jgi:chlorobactene glucosyltransferase